jgi:anti-sigma regulatory factor (Ser/Thr protein kinase)
MHCSINTQATLQSDDYSFRLQLANNHSQLPRLAQWIQNVSTECDLSNRANFSLDLVLTEATTNVMDYAGQPDGMIDIVCTIRSAHICLEIIDDGLPFDPTHHEATATPRTLDEATPGGHGIRLIRHYADDMQYRRDKNRNVLRISLPVFEPPASIGDLCQTT